MAHVEYSSRGFGRERLEVKRDSHAERKERSHDREDGKDRDRGE